MPRFGKASRERLDTCHPDLQLIFNEVVKIFDVSITEGHRSIERQQELFNADPPRTTIDGINKKGKHNSVPSMAVDVIQYKKGFNPYTSEYGLKSFYVLWGIVYVVADRLYKNGRITHKVRWGGDWNQNKDWSDQNFFDLPHFELVKV